MKHEPGSKERGSSLVEVLVALAILMFLMIGVLSMFSMAYLQNLGSAARTDMTYKAQQVADVIRYINFLQRSNSTVVPATSNTGLTFPLTTSGPITITALSGSNLQYAYWGPPSSTLQDAANILDPKNLPYDITVTIAAPNLMGLVTVTIAVVPKTTGNTRYKGSKIKWKEVDYVTQLSP